MKDEASIYVLRNPETKEVFYVGATTKSIKERLDNHYRHLNEVMIGNTIREFNPRLEYLRKILPLKAIIECIEVCDVEDMNVRETYYISKYKSEGHILTNVTSGGIGGDTYTNRSAKSQVITSLRMSQKLAGKPKPEGFAENLSKARLGTGNPMAGITKYGKIALFDDDKKLVKIFDFGFEFNVYFNSKYAYGNAIKKLCRNHKKNICEFQGKFIGFASKLKI